MSKINEKVKTGWYIPTAIKESFVEFCAHKGAITQEDCAGALFLWQHVPARLREWAKLEAKDSPVVEGDFWDGLHDGLDASIQALLESQPHKKKTGQTKTG